MQVIQVPREIIGIADHVIEISALPEPPVLHARQPRSQRALEASDQHRDIGPGSGRQHQMQVIVQQHMAVMPERMKASRVIKRFQCNGTRADLAQPRLACVAYEGQERSEEHTSELQSLMRNSYAVFCLKKKNCFVLYK